MTRRERRAFLALVADTVRPPAGLPRVEQTDAVDAFEAWLRAAPRLNRLVLRGALLVRGRVREADEVLRRLAAHMYYGDAAVMRALGYDHAAVLRRAEVARAC